MAETTDDRLRPEVWLPIDGFDYPYEVSNLGRVRNAASGHVLRPGLNRGYAHVSLSLEGKGKTVYIHRLVLLTFLGPAHHEGSQACHNNGVRSDNRLTNLRWVMRLKMPPTVSVMEPSNSGPRSARRN